MNNTLEYTITTFFLLLMLSAYSQKDSLQIGDSYWEDQLYINISYNLLDKQPKGVSSSGFSFGFSGGYIKDVPFSKSGKTALGIGLGYGFDSFNHSLHVVKGTPNTFIAAENITANKLKQHSLEMPIQFRWRTSTVNEYSFWRVYIGFKISYNLSNSFSYFEEGTLLNLSNIDEYNNWQTGLTMSAGYGTFNFHLYYGLTPIFKNAFLNGSQIDTRIIRVGMSFYLL